MKKNRMMFFGVTAVIAVFILFAAAHADAYALSPVPSSTANAYNADNSFENLFSPFTGFFKNLQWSNNTTINIASTSAGWPTVNVAPGLQSGLAGVLSRWGTEFNNWFYKLTGVELSGISYVLLNAIAWTLGLAQGVVRWLLGLFH
jgi:hypothetical protein